MKRIIIIALLSFSFFAQAQKIDPQIQILGKTFQSLTDAATITWDMYTGYNKYVTISGNRTLSITNAINGDYGTLVVIQDGTGGRTLSVPNGTVTINPSPNAITVICFAYDGTTFYWAGGFMNPITRIYRTTGKDSIQFDYWDGSYGAVLDSAGGGGTPAGGDRQVQYNNAGSFGASSNLVYNAAGELIVGGTDNGAFKLQSNGGLYSNGGQTYLYGGTIFLGDAFSQTKSSGDLLDDVINTTTTGVSRIQLQSGNGATSAKFNYLRFFNNNTAAQKWDFGTYGSDAITLRDVTAATTPFQIKNSTGQLVLSKYATGTTLTGTVNKYAAFDASGNVIAADAPTLQQVTTSGNTSTNLLKYSGNYGGSFDDRTLPDKNYVDSARNKARDSVVALIGIRALDVQTADVGNTSTTETDLHNATVAANTLSTDNDGLDFEFTYSYAANTNNKYIKIYFGTITISLPVSNHSAGGIVEVRGNIIRTSSTTAEMSGFMIAQNGTTTYPFSVDGSVFDFTSPITFKSTGTGGATNDILETKSSIRKIIHP